MGTSPTLCRQTPWLAPHCGQCCLAVQMESTAVQQQERREQQLPNKLRASASFLQAGQQSSLLESLALPPACTEGQLALQQLPRKLCPCWKSLLHSSLLLPQGSDMAQLPLQRQMQCALAAMRVGCLHQMPHMRAVMLMDSSWRQAHGMNGVQSGTMRNQPPAEGGVDR